MSWNNLVTDLLYTNHTRLIVDLNVGLRSGHTKTASVTRIVDCVELVFLVEHDMFNVVALRRVPADYAAIEAGTQKGLLLEGLVEGWLPGETGDWELHFFVFDFIESVTKHG